MLLLVLFSTEDYYRKTKTMTLIQIEYFIEVARSLNFTRAAKKLFITQQVVSKQIKALEKELNIPLFDRSNKQISLTEGGKILYVSWKKMLNETEEAIQNAREASKNSKIKIRLGINEIGSIIDYIMPAMVKYRNVNPNFELEYELGNSVLLEELLLKKKIDLLVTFSSELEGNKLLQYYDLESMNIDLGIILAKNHPLASRKKLSLNDLKEETIFILKDTYSKDAAERILNHFKEEGFAPRKLRWFDNINSMEIALNLGEGVTVAYNILFRNINTQLKFYPNEGNKGFVRTDLVIAWSTEKSENYAKEFSKIAKA